MLTNVAGKRASIIDLKSGTGDIPGMRRGKQEEASKRRAPDGFG